FPKVSVIRFDFAAYGDMPALKVFWYDGLKETPKMAGVPDGEWLGDPPSLPRPEGAGGSGAGPAAAEMRPAGNEFRSPGRVFKWEEFQALKAATKPLHFPQPDGSLF